MSENEKYAGLRRHSKESNELARECIRTAMIRLAKEMDMKAITVTQLCARAGVSRMAFYRNYSVINDVILEVANELNEEVVATVGSPFRKSTTREWYIETFRCIASHREEMTLMFSESFQHQWMKIVNGYVVHDERFSKEQKYQRTMWSGGFENAVAYWLNNGMQESPEEMAEYCIRYLPHMLNKENS